jgi:hypothetical protein
MHSTAHIQSEDSEPFAGPTRRGQASQEKNTKESNTTLLIAQRKLLDLHQIFFCF